MSLNPQQFEQAKTLVLEMDEKQKQDLSRLISLMAPRPTPRQEVRYGTAGDRLHRAVQLALHSKTQSNIPSLSNLKRLKPALARRFEEVGKLFDAEIAGAFKRHTTQEFLGLHRYFVMMAANRIEDCNKLLCPDNLLDALVPLSELVDDQLPGYRQAGVLQELVFRHIRGEKTC